MIERCRICYCPDLVQVMHLGDQGSASVFPTHKDTVVVKTPLCLVKCDECSLVQLQHTMDPDGLYKSMEYGYRSGINATMRHHLSEIVAEAVAISKPNARDTVLDIGSNDATLLKSYDNKLNLQRVGIDPTGAQFRNYYPMDVRLIPDFFSEATYGDNAKAKIVTSISMFYDLPAPQTFMNDVRSILDPEGIWVMEQSYLPSMLAMHSIDTICHEHLEYYCLTQINYMAVKANMRILKVSFDKCNGGSFRVILCHESSSFVQTIADGEIIKKTLEDEVVFSGIRPYEEFTLKSETLKKRLVTFLRCLKEQNKTIYVYGASTKGNTLLQYYGIDDSIITAAAERNISKYGKYTPVTNIPIVSEEEARSAKPDYMLVLPWHFKEEFLRREDVYIETGGQFIFPLPEIEVVSKKPIALVTGASGQIGTYMTKLLSDKGYTVYGTSRRLLSSQTCTVLRGDVVDILEILNPAEVYHFAAETNSERSFDKPTETLISNGVDVMRICEALRPSTRLFVANSTEIFKGNDAHINVMEDTMEGHMRPTTPYGIGKATAYWTAKLYRSQNRFVCSGILTNTESSLRRPEYVTRKIVDYAKGPRDVPLKLGQMSVFRDWIHASDVAEAAFTILQQPKAMDYIVSTGVTSSLYDFIDLALGETSWINNGTMCCDIYGNVLVESDAALHRSYEKNNGMVVYNNARLCSIGWTPKFTLSDIVDEMKH